MKDKFLEVVKEALELEDQDLSLDDVLADFDEWDSMTRLSLIALLDEYFEVQISDAEFDNIETIQHLMEVVKERMD